MKKISLNKDIIRPASQRLAKVMKMDYSTVSKGLVKQSKDDITTGNVQVTTPVGDRTLDKGTFENYKNVESAFSQMLRDIFNVVDKIQSEAYSAVIDLDEGVDYLVARLENKFKTYSAVLLEYVDRDGTKMEDLVKDIAYGFEECEPFIDKLVRRMHFRVDDLIRRRELSEVIPTSIESFKKNCGDSVNTISIVLPNAEPSDSKKEPMNKVVVETTDKKS